MSSKYTKEQERKFNLYYEEKYLKFYYKYLFHTGNIKERLLDCFDDFEYAYSLSQTEGVPEESKLFWEKMWTRLLRSPVQSDYRPKYFNFAITIHRMRFKTFEKYMLFFYEESERIITRRKTMTFYNNA